MPGVDFLLESVCSCVLLFEGVCNSMLFKSVCSSMLLFESVCSSMLFGEPSVGFDADVIAGTSASKESQFTYFFSNFAKL